MTPRNRVTALGGTALALVLFLAVLPAELSAPFQPTPERESLRVLFVGDIMLDRNVAKTAEEEGAGVLFAGVAALFAEPEIDLRVGNLEGTITTEESIARRNHKILRFTFSPALVEEALQPLKFDALSLANNHALDFGEFGYEETVDRLMDLGIAPFGSPYNDRYKLSTMLEHKGKMLCLVGYHSLFKSDTTSVLEEIARLRPSCWRLVVVPHWGEEYQHRSHAGQQEAAHAFIDAGADLIVGSHPHVVQEVEVYKNKAIFYSLGNFMFDQNFSTATQHSLAVVVEFAEAETHFSLIPTTIIDQRAGLAAGEARAQVLEWATVADFSLP